MTQILFRIGLAATVASFCVPAFAEKPPTAQGLIVEEFPRNDSQANNDTTFLEPEKFGKPIGKLFVIESLERWKHGQDRNAIARGELVVAKTGTYHFRTDSFYDRNVLQVNGETVCPFRDGTATSAAIELKKGAVLIEAVGYVNGRGETAGILVEWKPPGQREFSPIPPSHLRHKKRKGVLPVSPYEPAPEIVIPAKLLEPDSAGLYARQLTIVAKDFVTEIYHNGRRLKGGERELLDDIHGSTVERAEVDVKAGDWLVFHVAHNPLRHGGVKYFAVTGHLDDGRVGILSRADSEDWSACDNPELVNDFILSREAGTESRAIKIAKPWDEGKKYMEKYTERRFCGDPIWGAAPSTWIKYVVPNREGAATPVVDSEKETESAEPLPAELAISSPKRWPVQIVSAIYGTGGKNADVTEKVREFVEEKRAFFAANPGHLGVDPNPYWNKGLHIVFMKDGVRREQRRNENEHILPESFYGPQDAAELAEWIVGTRWQGPRGEVQFHPNGRLMGPELKGEGDWKSVRANRLEIIWPKEKEATNYEFDYIWSSFRVPADGKNEYRIMK